MGGGRSVVGEEEGNGALSYNSSIMVMALIFHGQLNFRFKTAGINRQQAKK